MDKNRRRIIKSIGAATASSLAAPYLNLAHAQGSPIPLGVALPLTGNAGAYGPDMAEAAKRTAAKINAGGGVLGRKLELFIEDSESSAAVAANLSHKFINVHKAQALVGYWGTPEGMSSRPIAIQNKVVLMVSSAANAITEGDTQGYVWRFQLKATDWGTVISRATLNKLGFKSVGVMGLQNAFVLPIMKVFEEQMKANGRQVVDSLIYNPEQPSYRAEVERIFGKNPEAVYCFGLLPDFVSIMKEVYRGGFESKVVALSIMADAEGKFVQAVGPKVAEGIRHFQPMPDVSAPGYKKCHHRAGHGKGEEPDGGGLVEADHPGRQRARPGSRRRGRGAEARARRHSHQLPGRGLDLRLHAERRPARPRHGTVDHPQRQEPVRGIRQAVIGVRPRFFYLSCTTYRCSSPLPMFFVV